MEQEESKPSDLSVLKSLQKRIGGEIRQASTGRYRLERDKRYNIYYYSCYPGGLYRIWRIYYKDMCTEHIDEMDVINFFKHTPRNTTHIVVASGITLMAFEASDDTFARKIVGDFLFSCYMNTNKDVIIDHRSIKLIRLSDEEDIWITY